MMLEDLIGEPNADSASALTLGRGGAIVMATLDGVTVLHTTLPTTGRLVGLRREPKQGRSRARVDAIITALVELVGERIPSELTTTDVADRAGVPIGSLYEYFEDLPAIVDAAVARMLDRHDELLLAAPTPETAHEFVDVLFDAYLVLYAEQPGFVTLRNSTLFEPHHRQWLAERVEGFLDRAGTAAAARGVVGGEAGPDARLGLVIVTGDAMLQRIFRDDPTGDLVLIAESRVVLKFMVDRLAVEPG
jgi:AcrR family transcriptional regulator